MPKQSDATYRAAEEEVSRALRDLDELNSLRPRGPQLDERVLEVGGHSSRILSVLFACQGAKVTRAALPWGKPDSWNPERDPLVYRVLLQRVCEERHELDPSPIARIVETEAYDSVLTLSSGEPGKLSRLEGPFDLVITRRMLSRVVNPNPLLTAFGRLTSPGGFGIHELGPRDRGQRKAGRGVLEAAAKGGFELAREVETRGLCRWIVLSKPAQERDLLQTLAQGQRVLYVGSAERAAELREGARELEEVSAWEPGQSLPGGDYDLVACETPATLEGLDDLRAALREAAGASGEVHFDAEPRARAQARELRSAREEAFRARAAHAREALGGLSRELLLERARDDLGRFMWSSWETVRDGLSRRLGSGSEGSDS